MNKIKIVGYRINQDQDYGHIDTRKYSALDYNVVFTTVDAAENEISCIFEIERRRFENSLAIVLRTPSPSGSRLQEP